MNVLGYAHKCGKRDLPMNSDMCFAHYKDDLVGSVFCERSSRSVHSLASCSHG